MTRLQALYDSEINWRFQCFFDDKFYWVLGDTIAAGTENTIEEAIEALWQAAKKHYPLAECFKEEKFKEWDKMGEVTLKKIDEIWKEK